MSTNLTVFVCVISALCFSSCMQQRQIEAPRHEAQPSVAHFVGDELSRDVPPALTAITTAALNLLFSDRAASYSNWPDALMGNPPKGPFKELSVIRLDYIGQSNVIQVFLLESDPRSGRSFSVYWDADTGQCQEICISMK